ASMTIPTCQTIKVFAFPGNRSRPFAKGIQRKLDAEKNGSGPGPSIEECQLYAGHTGVSTDGGTTIFGFNPHGTGIPVWQMLDSLKKGDRFHGVVRDDSAVFTAAKKGNQTLVTFDIIL